MPGSFTKDLMRTQNPYRIAKMLERHFLGGDPLISVLCMYQDSSKLRVIGLLSRVTAFKTPEQPPCLHVFPIGERFLFGHVTFSGLRAFISACGRSVQRMGYSAIPFLLSCSVHNMRLQCVDMSISKADAVTIAFGSLLLSPAETGWLCAAFV